MPTSVFALAEHSIVGDDRPVLVLGANFVAPFRLAKMLGEKMLEASRGSLINVSSASGSAAYNASKHNSIGLIRTFAAGWGDGGVRADAVCQRCSRKWPTIGCTEAGIHCACASDIRIR